MKDSTRARVAAIVGAAVTRAKVSSAYDYASGRHRNVSAETSAGRVDGYDYSTSSHFSGSSGVGGTLDFYDYGTRGHVNLKLDGTKFSGYDYHTSSHFSGSVSGKSVSIYDYQTSKHYTYSL